MSTCVCRQCRTSSCHNLGLDLPRYASLHSMRSSHVHLPQRSSQSPSLCVQKINDRSRLEFEQWRMLRQYYSTKGLHRSRSESTPRRVNFGHTTVKTFFDHQCVSEEFLKAYDSLQQLKTEVPRLSAENIPVIPAYSKEFKWICNCRLREEWGCSCRQKADNSDVWVLRQDLKEQGSSNSFNYSSDSFIDQHSCHRRKSSKSFFSRTFQRMRSGIRNVISNER